jgi:hypothetical protein
MIFSGKKNGNWGFYLEADGLDPESVCMLEDSDHIALIGEANSSGKVLRWHDNGEPYLSDPPPPSDEELVATALAERDRLFGETVDRLCNACRWEDMGEELKEAWRQFRRALKDINEQPGFPRDIVWPQAPERA